MFLFSVLNLPYVFDPNTTPISNPTEDVSKEEKERIAKLKKMRNKDNFVCWCHILNTLSNRLYNLYMLIQSPLEIWKSLEEKYNNERQGPDKLIKVFWI